ncbi:DUF5684 domain-containing protein [Fusobacterium sp. PH5-44]|uniref:DUF5684 domain-containing protein n=1 Tax=unclassified Fusobacterium TaxID=2648384 RepID=UPI003D1E2621
MNEEVLASSIIVIFYLVFLVTYIIAIWKIFTKAGEKGWKSIIPIYNGYIMVTKIARKPKLWFWAPFIGLLCLFFIGLLVGILQYAFYSFATIGVVILSIVTIVYVIFSIVIMVKTTHAISRNFGQGTGFTVGLIFLPWIFLMILAFSVYKYKPISDYESNNNNNNNNNNNKETEEYEYIEIDDDNDDEYEYIEVDDDEDNI